jgi:hypothetical protein
VHIHDRVYHLVDCDEGGDWVEIHDSGPPTRQNRWLPHALRKVWLGGGDISEMGTEAGCMDRRLIRSASFKSCIF